MRRTFWAVLALGLVAVAIPATAGAAKTAAPTSLAFPPTAIDAKSAPQTVSVGIGETDDFRSTEIYITNCSTSPCLGSGQACSPSGFCPFEIVANDCPTSFGPMGTAHTCSISVSATPYDFARLGKWYGTLEIGTGWPVVNLSGDAILGGKSGGKKKKCKRKGKKRSAAAAKKKCKKKRK
jgi:hypothetical protein